MSGAVSTGGRRLAQVRVGRFHIAIDSALVETVVCGPLPITPFPCVAPHVLGAFASRTGPMPAVDLGALLAGHTAATTTEVVNLAVVLRLNEARFALVIDAIGAVVPVAAGHLASIDRHSSDGAGLFTELFAPASGEQPSVVLDIEAVLRIGDLHTAVQVSRADDAKAVDEAEAFSVVVLRAGDALFALDVTAVAHVEKRTATNDGARRHPSLPAFLLHGGHHLAVLELLAMLELPPSERADAGSHLVIVANRSGAGTAIVVDGIVAVVRASRGAIQPLSDEAPAGGPLVSGCLHDPTHGILVLLSADALVAATPALRGGAAQDARGDTGGRGVEGHFMVYRAGGGLLASQLTDVAAVAQLPGEFVDLRREGSPMVGIFSRFGEPVQVLDLGVLMGHTPLRTVVAQPLLIVETPSGAQGFLVESLSVLRSATPSRIPSPGRRSVGLIPPLAEMISVASDGADRSATVLDLRQLAERTSQLVRDAVAA